MTGSSAWPSQVYLIVQGTAHGLAQEVGGVRCPVSRLVPWALRHWNECSCCHTYKPAPATTPDHVEQLRSEPGRLHAGRPQHTQETTELGNRYRVII